MSGVMAMTTRRALGRALLAVVLLTGIAMATSVSRAGATIPFSWGTINFPAGMPDNDCGNEFAVDAAGNIYTINLDGGIDRYTPSSNTTVTLDAGHSFGQPCAEFGFGAFFTADAAGNVYVSASGDGGTIYEISPSGAQSVVTTALEAPGPLATDANGHLYAYDFATGSVYEIVSGVPQPLNFVGSEAANSMAVAPDGSVYLSEYIFGHNVYHVTASRVTTDTSWCNPESVAVDATGNLFVAAECASSLSEVPVGGSPDVLTTVPGGYTGGGDEVFIVGSALYYTDEGASHTIFTNSVTRPLALSVTATDQTVNGVLGQTVTATWNGVTGALGYTCTLMYGLGTPSSFTITTPNRTCSFANLSPTTEYGIQVVANSGSATSPPSVGFATPPPIPSSTTTPPPPKKHSIVCQKNHGTAIRSVTAVHPHCPSGWHRIG